MSLAERLADVVDVPVVAGLHSLAAGKLSGEPPDEDAFVCGDDADAKAHGARARAEARARPRGRRRAAALGARARGDDRPCSSAINRRYKIHAGLRVTGLR